MCHRACCRAAVSRASGVAVLCARWRFRPSCCTTRWRADWSGWRWSRASRWASSGSTTRWAAAAVGIAEIDVLPSHGRRGIGAALARARLRLGARGRLPAGGSGHAGGRAMECAVLCAARLLRWSTSSAPEFAFGARSRSRERFSRCAAGLHEPAAAAHAGTDDWSVWPAPAKLNLFLRIVGRRADGYHELQTVFRLLDWGDEVRLRVRADGRIERAGRGGRRAGRSRSHRARRAPAAAAYR